MTPTIQVLNLSKKYQLGGFQPYLTIRESLNSLGRLPQQLIGQWITPGGRLAKNEFWALRGVSFEVGRGEIVGIIGRNGAGKSTLLKILSRITPPTLGQARLTGNVSSLLEVGTGFNSELTGRENIFLNGAILGMGRSEIKRKFDDIVDFAEVRRFIDSPVKHYSSGMYMRLAFAIAAHVETEILLLDEVLAVGDIQFQRKCYQKIKESIASGRTVLFISHNMSAVSNLCPRSLFIDGGKLVSFGPSEKVISHYYQSLQKEQKQKIKVRSYLKGTGKSWELGKQVAVEVSWKKHQLAPGWECDIAAYTMEGVKIFAVQSQSLPGFSSQDPTLNKITFFVTNPGFLDRDLRVDVGIRKRVGEPYGLVFEDCLRLHPGSQNLPSYKISDAVIVPKISCEVVRS